MAICYPFHFIKVSKNTPIKIKSLQTFLLANANMETNNLIPKSSKGKAVENIKSFGAIIGSSFIVGLLSFSKIVNADSNFKIVVLGSSGKTGKKVIEILGSKGYNVRPTYRDVTNKEGLFNTFSSVEKPTIADVTKIETLESAIQGASTVVFAASASNKGGNAQQVDFKGVENVAKECIRLKIPRLIVISRYLSLLYYYLTIIIVVQSRNLIH